MEKYITLEYGLKNTRNKDSFKCSVSRRIVKFSSMSDSHGLFKVQSLLTLSIIYLKRLLFFQKEETSSPNK